MANMVTSTAANTTTFVPSSPPNTVEVPTKEPNKLKEGETGKRQFFTVELSNKRARTDGQELETNKAVVGDSDLFTSLIDMVGITEHL